VVTTILTVCSAYAGSAERVVLLITLGSAFSGMASPAVWAGLIDLGGKSAAVVSGTSNMIGCLAGVLFTPLVGMLVDAIKVNGSGWELLILVHAGFYACAALAFAMVRIGDRPVTETETDDQPPGSEMMPIPSQD
jgi:MFS family permease